MGISFPSGFMEAASGRIHYSGGAASTTMESLMFDGKIIPIPDEDHVLNYRKREDWTGCVSVVSFSHSVSPIVRGCPGSVSTPVTCQLA